MWPSLPEKVRSDILAEWRRPSPDYERIAKFAVYHLARSEFLDAFGLIDISIQTGRLVERMRTFGPNAFFREFEKQILAHIKIF